MEYEGLTFVTVRGAGHEVPLHRPGQALVLFQHFLQGEPMPAEVSVPLFGSTLLMDQLMTDHAISCCMYWSLKDVDLNLQAKNASVILLPSEKATSY
jgi:hypothetical protein